MSKIYMTDWPLYGPNDSTGREGTVSMAKLMANAAFTAPKSGGIPTIECSTAFGQEEQKKISKRVEELSLVNPRFKQWHVICRSKAIMVREADGILFIESTCAGETIFDVGSATYLACQKLGYCPNSKKVVGIPVASLAKNLFLDITPDYECLNFNKVVKKLRKDFAVDRQVHWFDYRNWYPKDKGKEE